MTFKENFLYSLHWFRGVAIIFVVLAHVIPKLDSNHQAYTVLQAFFANGTLFFVFISGYLFWHLKERYHYKTYLVSKLKNVISPYVAVLSFAVVVALIIELLGGGQVGNQKVEISFLNPLEPFSGILWHYWVGTSIIVPLWFIPFIALVFLSSWFIYKVADSRYFGFVMSIFLLISFFTYRASLESSPYIYPFLMYWHFLGVFLFGIYLKKYEEVLYRNASRLILILGAVFIGFQVIYVAHMLEPLRLLSSGGWLNGLDLGQVKMLFGVMFFLVLLFYIEEKLRGSELSLSRKGLVIPSLDLLARYSFGIFFIHTFVLKFLEVVHRKLVGEVDNLWSLFVIAVLTFVISVLVIKMIKIIFKSKSRYLVGS